VDDAEAVIGAGNVRARVPRAHVLEVLAPQPRPRPRARRRGTSGPAEVHVRGERVVEALEQVDLALDAALLQGASALRVVHGIGTGTLRRAIRGHVGEHPSVVDVADAEPAAGGVGVTVVALAGG
jgi:DNA mismatch repair protein MutS2